MGIRLLGSVVNGEPIKTDRRVVQLHKKNAKKPAKLSAPKAEQNSSKSATKAAAKPAPKADEPPVAVEDPIEDLGDIELKDEVDIDFDDLGLDKD